MFPYSNERSRSCLPLITPLTAQNDRGHGVVLAGTAVLLCRKLPFFEREVDCAARKSYVVTHIGSPRSPRFRSRGMPKVATRCR